MQTTADMQEIIVRLVAAVLAGGALGIDREWRDKPAGIRTLALVSLGAALVCVSTTHLAVLDAQPDAMSRVVQGIIQGIMAGVGFLGAGAVLQKPGENAVEGLTTAATVWVAAAIGVACGLANWTVAASLQCVDVPGNRRPRIGDVTHFEYRLHTRIH
jgi:putative Mg2+ transporter-C (MgtC) family protein